MNTAGTLTASPGGPQGAVLRRDSAGVAAGIGLWVFIGVASALFLLFITAYVMRMTGPTGRPSPCRGNCGSARRFWRPAV